MENEKTLKILDCYFVTKEECTDATVSDANTILQCECNGKDILLEPGSHFSEKTIHSIAPIMETDSVIVFFDEGDGTVGRYIFNGQFAVLQHPSWNELTVNGKSGMLKAYPSSDPDYPGIYICLIPKDCDTEVDVAVAEVMDKVNLYCYTDVHSDDWTQKYVLDPEEIRKPFN